MTKVSPSDASVKWDGGPNVGTLDYDASANFIWNLKVNVAEITVSAPAGAFVPRTPVAGTAFMEVTSGNPWGLKWSADVKIASPGGADSIKHLTAGFVQNVKITTLSIGYGSPVPAFASPRSKVVGSTYLDTVKASRTPFYEAQTAEGAFVVGKTSGTISASDTPGFTAEKDHLTKQVSQLKMLYDFTLFVACTTNEDANEFAAQAYAVWAFNGNGVYVPVPGGLGWSNTVPPTAKVTPPAGWTAETPGSKVQPVTTGTKANALDLTL